MKNNVSNFHVGKSQKKKKTRLLNIENVNMHASLDFCSKSGCLFLQCVLILINFFFLLFSLSLFKNNNCAVCGFVKCNFTTSALPNATL